jgi:hypothetical protein
VLREIAGLNEAARVALGAAGVPPPSAEENMGLALRPGARVFDVVTGQEGEVIAGSRAHYLVPSAQR